MKIGDYKLYSIETSEFSLDGGAMFGIIPKVLWEKSAIRFIEPYRNGYAFPFACK